MHQRHITQILEELVRIRKALEDRTQIEQERSSRARDNAENIWRLIKEGDCSLDPHFDRVKEAYKEQMKWRTNKDNGTV